MSSLNNSWTASFCRSYFPRNLLTFNVLTFNVLRTVLSLRGADGFSHGDVVSCRTHQKVALSFARTVWMTGALAGARPS